MRAFKLLNVFISHFNFTFLIIFIIVPFLILILLFWYTNVAFICQNNNTYIGTAMFFYFFQPAININKTFFISKIKNNKNTISSLVICFGNGSISFLTSSIPNLKSNCALIYLKSSKSKVDTNCCNVVFLEIVILYKKYKSIIDHLYTYRKPN